VPILQPELRAYAALSTQIAAVGARFIAISPQRPENTRTGQGFPFPVLSDEGSKVAKAFGVAFDLTDELRPLYTRLGHPLPEMNGAGWGTANSGHLCYRAIRRGRAELH
jgi:hypothetical protein